MLVSGEPSGRVLVSGEPSGRVLVSGEPSDRVLVSGGPGFNPQSRTASYQRRYKNGTSSALV